MFRIVFFYFVLIFLGLSAWSYRIEEGKIYASGGFGAQVNVVRFNDLKNRTPKSLLPLVMNIDYAVDKNWGVFGSFIPQFAADNFAVLMRGGIKYWFNFSDAPYVPYASLALTPQFLIPAGVPNHFNLGLSPGAGINYFVLSSFMIGAHINLNPSIAFAGGETKFEFSVMSYFDVSMKI